MASSILNVPRPSASDTLQSVGGRSLTSARQSVYGRHGRPPPHTDADTSIAAPLRFWALYSAYGHDNERCPAHGTRAWIGFDGPGKDTPGETGDPLGGVREGGRSDRCRFHVACIPRGGPRDAAPDDVLRSALRVARSGPPRLAWNPARSERRQERPPPDDRVARSAGDLHTRLRGYSGALQGTCDFVSRRPGQPCAQRRTHDEFGDQTVPGAHSVSGRESVDWRCTHLSHLVRPKIGRRLVQRADRSDEPRHPEEGRNHGLAARQVLEARIREHSAGSLADRDRDDIADRAHQTGGRCNSLRLRVADLGQSLSTGRSSSRTTLKIPYRRGLGHDGSAAHADVPRLASTQALVNKLRGTIRSVLKAPYWTSRSRLDSGHCTTGCIQPWSRPCYSGSR